MFSGCVYRKGVVDGLGLNSENYFSFSPVTGVLHALMEVDLPCSVWMQIVFIPEDSVFPSMSSEDFFFLMYF